MNNDHSFHGMTSVFTKIVTRGSKSWKVARRDSSAMQRRFRSSRDAHDFFITMIPGIQGSCRSAHGSNPERERESGKRLMG